MNKKSPRKKPPPAVVIDKISEDSFFENLLLGFPKLLKQSPFITKTSLERYRPATAAEVHKWECANAVHLPDDLRNFYLSTNGFSFTYRFQYDIKPAENSDDISHVIGGIEINPLQNLTRLNNNEVDYVTEFGQQFLPEHSKIFTLQIIDDVNSVVLARFHPQSVANFWLYSKGRHFYFLCNEFRTYFLMALAHVGVPGWQFNLLNANLPEWSTEMLQLLAPDVLRSSKNVFLDPGNKCETYVNFLNLDIFKDGAEDDSSLRLKIDGEKVKNKDEKGKKCKSARSSARSANNKNKK